MDDLNTDALDETSNYFNSVKSFDVNQGWKSFSAITDGKYGSRIPVTKVSNLPEFIELLNSKLISNDFVFRGHRCFDWGLTSTLGRLNDKGIVTEPIAEKALELFKKFTRNRPLNLQLSDENNDGNNYEVWAIGQHYGLMTPLLDWTFSPYVALFFAFAKEDRSSNNPFRAVYFFNKTKICELNSKVEILEPKYDNHGRLVSQAGLFTISPYEEAIENEIIDAYSKIYENEENYAEVDLAQYLCKVYVPNKERSNILKNLRSMNIHHGTLFPDLQGAADHSNILIEEFYNQQEVINKITDTVEVDIVNELPLVQHNTDEQQELAIRTLKISPETVQSIQNLSDNLNRFLTSSELQTFVLKTENVIREVSSRLANSTTIQDFAKLVYAISEKLAPLTQTVDWNIRDNIKAEGKNKIRAELRKEKVVSNEDLPALTDKIWDEFVNINLDTEHLKNV